MFIRFNKKICQWLESRGWVPIDPYVGIKFPDQVASQLLAVKGICRVLECGGVDRPILTGQGRPAIYDGLDVDERVLTCPVYDSAHCQSVVDKIEGKYDVIFSKYLLEHVDDVPGAFKSMAGSLAPGGVMLHLVPGGMHPYSIVTRLIGNRLQRLLIRLIRPNRAATTGYPVFFDKCTYGGLLNSVRKAGLDAEVTYVAYGASKYFDFFVPAFIMVKCFNSIARLTSFRLVASGLVIVGRKSCDLE